MVTFLDGVAAVEVVLRMLDNVTLYVQTVWLLALLLRAVTDEPAPLAADVKGYGVVGRAPAFPALTEPVLSRFRRPRLPLVPDVSARKFLPAQVIISLPGDFWQPEENALAALDPGHTPSQLQLRFGMSGTNSSVTPD